MKIRLKKPKTLEEVPVSPVGLSWMSLLWILCCGTWGCWDAESILWPTHLWGAVFWCWKQSRRSATEGSWALQENTWVYLMLSLPWWALLELLFPPCLLSTPYLLFLCTLPHSASLWRRDPSQVTQTLQYPVPSCSALRTQLALEYKSTECSRHDTFKLPESSSSSWLLLPGVPPL